MDYAAPISPCNNSRENQTAELLFRIADSKIVRRYTQTLPKWAEILKLFQPNVSRRGAYDRNVDLQLCFKNIMFVPHNKYRIN